MKAKTVILALSVFWALACSRGDKMIPTALELSTYSISVLAGDRADINVLSAGEYGILPGDSAIAELSSIRETGFTIKANGVGTTSMWVVDRVTGQRAEVVITGCPLDGLVIEKANISSRDKWEVFVQADDPQIQEEIERWLWEYTWSRQLTAYRFDAKTGTFTIDFSETRLGLSGIYEGTYEWTKDTLTLHYNGVTEIFGFGIRPGSGAYYLLEDFTQRFQTLYPNAGIRCAESIRPFTRPLVILGGFE